MPPAYPALYSLKKQKQKKKNTLENLLQINDQKI